jgi:type IV secretion system protein VirB11
MLRTAMGPAIAAALEDPQVVEILLNPDGSLWLDRLGTGREPSGLSMSASDAERIIRLVAAHVHAEVHAGAPILSAELPETGERFEGVLPPVVRAPAFAIRKRASTVISLSRYVADGILTREQAAFLRQAVRERNNILICGATSTGKTTLANALLVEVAATGDRVIILEDPTRAADPGSGPLRAAPAYCGGSERHRPHRRSRHGAQGREHLPADGTHPRRLSPGTDFP